MLLFAEGTKGTHTHKNEQNNCKELHSEFEHIFHGFPVISTQLIVTHAFFGTYSGWVPFLKILKLIYWRAFERKGIQNSYTIKSSMKINRLRKQITTNFKFKNPDRNYIPNSRNITGHCVNELPDAHL